MNLKELTMDVEQEVEIRAAMSEVFEKLCHRLTEGNTRPDGVAMPMKIERRPGGRWYRDLGGDSGHLWATVQSFRPPDLIEFQGPMFMSCPVAGHLIIRLAENSGVTTLKLRHRALGLIEEEHCAGLATGWGRYLNLVKTDSEE